MFTALFALYTFCVIASSGALNVPAQQQASKTPSSPDTRYSIACTGWSVDRETSSTSELWIHGTDKAFLRG